MRGESFNSFNNGLDNQYRPISQPKGTYINALNMVRRKDGTLFNEGGTLNLVGIANGLEVIGSLVLEEDIILFQTDGTNHEIGVIVSNDTYTVITQSPLLNFALTNQIKAQGKKNSLGQRVIQFTDNGQNPPRYLNLDDPDLTNLNVFFSFNIPTIDLVSVNETGQLTTGIYQFAARLLTSTTNSTAFGFVSGIVPIVDDIRNQGRDNYDGAPPQTRATKSITIEVNNISPSFEFVEIAAITYTGTSNQLDVNIIARIPIQGRTSIQFTYSDPSQKREDGVLSLGELIQEFPNYIGAKCIEQKDGRYFYSNLQAAKTQVDFQAVANNIVVKYVIEEVIVPVEDISLKFRYTSPESGDIPPFPGPAHDEDDDGTDLGTSPSSYNDYKNELLTFNKKGYMRGEVYSLSITPVFVGGNVGNSYHIPGNDKSAIETTDANTTTKLVGTFVSASEYPEDYGYPSGFVRHHIMPTLIQEPHFTSDGTNYTIRILGLEISNVDLSVLGGDADLIQGWIIGREIRSEDNKSILTQGIAQYVASSNATSNNVFTPPYTQFYLSPVTGKFPWISTTLSPSSSTLTKDQGANLVGFYSPESVLYQRQFTGASNLQSALRVTGEHHAVYFKIGDDDGKNDNYWHSFINYNNSETNDIAGGRPPIDPTTLQYIPADSTPNAGGSSFTPTGIPGITIWNDSNNGFLFFKLSNDSELIVERPYLNGRPEFMYHDTNNDGDVTYLHDIAKTGSYDFANSNILSADGDYITGYSDRLIYNLTSNKPSQYGEIYDASYISIGYTNVTTSPVEYFNGDTFISKFALESRTRRFGDGDSQQEKYFTTNYIWLESEINGNYRHYVQGNDITGAGTIPYYPKFKTFVKGDGTGLYEIPASLGHSTGYNKQYSFENAFKTYFPQQLGVGIVEEFPNRTIYSEQSIEGEQFDANRLFLPNNYHDIPKNKGEIIDTFVFNKVLYLHTSQSLWRTSINERSALVTDVGSVYTGNGGLFPVPSEEVMTVSGGYAGTTSQWAGCTTPFGRFFIDNIQSKVFLFTEVLNEISSPSLTKYFTEILNPDSIDNPSNGRGWVSGFDYTNNRWILTKVDSTEPITISYSIDNQSWSSFHSYIPNHMVSRGRRLFLTNTGTYKLWEINKGVKGGYFNSVTPNVSSIKLVINEAPNSTKKFENLVLFTSSRDTQGDEKHLDTFNEIMCYTNFQCTGSQEIVPGRFVNIPFTDLLFKTKAILVNNEFRLSIPHNLVNNADLDILDESNWVRDSSFDSTPNIRKFRDNMRGKWMVVELIYNNENNYELDLYMVRTLFSNVDR